MNGEKGTLLLALSPLPHLLASMINADFCAGSVLISFGALLGKTSPVQLLLMAGLEVTLFGLNEYILLNILQVNFWAPRGRGLTPHPLGWDGPRARNCNPKSLRSCVRTSIRS